MTKIINNIIRLSMINNFWASYYGRGKWKRKMKLFI